jgi:putative transposase
VLTLQQEHQCIFLKEQFILILSHLKQLVGTSLDILRVRFIDWTKPLSSSLPLGTLADLARSKADLVAENALLRQQLIILKRQVKRPACTNMDRMLLVLGARAVRAWKQTHMTRSTRNPAALASWAFPPVLEAQVKGLFTQAQGSRWNYRIDQRDGDGKSASSVRRGFVGNSWNWAFVSASEPFRSTWGLFALTSQEDRSGQPLYTITRRISGLATRFPVTDLFFRPLFAFFIIELKSRKIIHVNVTRSPTDPWVAQ